MASLNVANHVSLGHSQQSLEMDLLHKSQIQFLKAYIIYPPLQPVAEMILTSEQQQQLELAI